MIIVDTVLAKVMDQVKSFGEWKQFLLDNGIIVQYNEPINDETRFDLKELKEKCSFEIEEVESISDPEEWRKEFQEYLDSPPEIGDCLITEDGSDVRINIECHSGHPPFMFARAYVPRVVGSKLGWFAQSINDDRLHGWKVIMIPKTRNQITREKGIRESFIGVKEITIVRLSTSKKSLLAEVTKW